MSTIRKALWANHLDNPAAVAGRIDLLQTGQYGGPEVAAIKAVAPKTVCLLYMFAGGIDNRYIVEDDPVGLQACMEHPEWYILDDHGQRIPFADYPYIWALDPGMRSYQDAFIESCLKFLERTGCDGIKLDNINSFTTWNFPQEPVLRGDYWLYSAAMTAFVQRVTSALQSHGYLLVGNGSRETWDRGPWASWIRFMDGREYEPAGNDPREPDAQWRAFQRGFSSDPGKLYISYVLHWRAHPEWVPFQVASFLMWQGPRSYLSLGFWDGVGEVPSHHLMDTEIGRPVGDARRLDSGVWRRDYEQGAVWLNPTTAPARIRTENGLVTLGPRECMIGGGL